MKRAQIPSVKEPVGLLRQHGKCPDGTTILPWSRGKPMAWDVTVPDTYAPYSISAPPDSLTGFQGPTVMSI